MPPEYLGRTRVGAVGRAAGADLQSPLRADRPARAARARAASARYASISPPEKISGIERGRDVAADKGSRDRRPGAGLGQAMLKPAELPGCGCCKDCCVGQALSLPTTVEELAKRAFRTERSDSNRCGNS